jgi:hypothetical protein
MGKSQAPQPPNPYQTAQAQTASNKETAIAQTGLNAQNQVTPYGNLTYSQEGTWADGTPKFTATQTLTPAQQGILNSTQGTQQNLANTAQEQSGKLSGLLNSPFSLDNTAVESRINELARMRLDPQLQQQQTALDTKLANQGIRLGSAAYDRAQLGQGQIANDARNQLLLTGRQQSISEALTQRNQPLNEILALAGQGQIQQPSFAQTPQTGVAGTDIAGLVNNQYNAQNQQYMNQQQQQNGLLGGLFGLGANALMMSDRRAKTDIKRVGTADNSLPIYSYRYKSGGPVQIGFMADEVRQVNPGAVVRGDDGLDRVNYERAAE